MAGAQRVPASVIGGCREPRPVGMALSPLGAGDV